MASLPAQPPVKARERSEQEHGGGWGATGGSELEGGSEGIGRPPADGRNSSAVAVAVAYSIPHYAKTMLNTVLECSIEACNLEIGGAR